MDKFKIEYERFFDQFKEKTSIIVPETIDDDDIGDDDDESETKQQQQQQNSEIYYSFSFDEFLKYFKKFKFAHLIAWIIQKQDSKFIREYFDETTEFVLAKISSTNSLESRIFAFYVLYSLWAMFCRIYPSIPFRIRMNQQSLSFIQDLVGDSLKRNQFDIFIGYQKMVTDGAFAYCQSIQLLGPYYKDYIYKSYKLQDVDETNPSNFYKEIESNLEFYESLLNEFDNIDYQSMKQCLTDINNKKN
ncbi:hypothetical protein DERP_002532 [Dermatophagoides pteronyssinus]|uniref:Transmembrane protein n=1 Tax=Dermatophagoides pteronyssinus TaxID=6956 RepID=A0ABQ8JIK3_DERPT|nr:hypothetical protein DERP_002532 [Dermatophagoides pteronyssinus]